MAEIIYISGTSVRFASGKFDTANYYIRGGAGGADFPMVQGKTIYLTFATSGYITGYKKPNWICHTGNYSVESFQNGSASGFVPTYTTVKLK